MLIPKLNKFQAIPKKKYRVISEDPQICVKPFPWKPGVRKTSLENWKTNTRWSSRIRCVSSEIIYANYGELGVSPLWVTPLAYHNVIIKRLIIIQECHSLQKKKKILSHLNTVAFTAIKQVSAIWCKLFNLCCTYWNFHLWHCTSNQNLSVTKLIRILNSSQREI